MGFVVVQHSQPPAATLDILITIDVGSQNYSGFYFMK